MEFAFKTIGNIAGVWLFGREPDHVTPLARINDLAGSKVVEMSMTSIGPCLKIVDEKAWEDKICPLVDDSRVPYSGWFLLKLPKRSG